ncbi:hypothetical protein C4K14_2410 [Pseudomonas chlororaphis subsp. aureofaciens]|nr:hypothetical protein C4K14_2410 [Pseudomonas chlororaphis subsp. aureofaciens]
MNLTVSRANAGVARVSVARLAAMAMPRLNRRSAVNIRFLPRLLFLLIPVECAQGRRPVWPAVKCRRPAVGDRQRREPRVKNATRA